MEDSTGKIMFFSVTVGLIIGCCFSIGSTLMSISDKLDQIIQLLSK